MGLRSSVPKLVLAVLGTVNSRDGGGAAREEKEGGEEREEKEAGERCQDTICYLILYPY